MRRRLLVVALSLFAVCLVAPSLAGADNATLAPTPPMGFNDWNAYGCHVDAALIQSQARFIHDSGLQRDGYDDVNIDDCWLQPHRSASGALVPDRAKFLHGIRGVAEFVHHLGLKLGLYEDAGTKTCGGYPGSYGHYAQDARSFASWGVDYLKFDQCYMPFSRYPGQSREQVDTRLYTAMSHALRESGRPIVFSMCNGWDRAARPWRWGAAVSNLWRTTADIKDNFASTLHNFTGNVGLWPYAHAGAFNDPDALEIGNGGQTLTEYRSQFSLWAEMAAPLIAGTNLRALPRADLAIYENRRVIAVDQDPLARQGRPIRHTASEWVLSKPLTGGAHAVALFNPTSRPRTIATSARAAGAAAAPAYALENLWGGRTTETAGRIAAFVPAYGTVIYRVTAATARRAPTPQTELSVATTPGAGGPVAHVSLRDDSPVGLRATAATLAAPAGFTPRRVRVALPALAAGRAATRTVTLHAPVRATAPLRVGELRASVRATAGDGAAVPDVASDPIRTLAPLATPYDAADLTGQPARIGGLGDAFSITAAGAGVAPPSFGPTAPIGAAVHIPADDSYAAVDDPGAAAVDSTAEVTVRAQNGSPLSPVGAAGLVERAGFAHGATEGAVLGVDTAGTVTLSWAGRGGAVVSSAVSAPHAVTLPVTLRLQRHGSRYVGAYSRDGGRRWTVVARAQVPAAAARGAQDVGVFHSSGTAGWFTTAAFSGFSVTG